MSEFQTFSILLSILLLTALMLPVIQETFGESQTDVGVDTLTDNLKTEANEPTGLWGATTKAFSIIGYLFKAFVWSFGVLPAWLDAIFLIIRISFFWHLVRVIRGSG